jgi:hypothetical protein
MDCRAYDYWMQVARVPAPRSPTARTVPYWVTDSRRTKYSVVDTTWVHYWYWPISFIIRFLPDGVDFIASKLEVLLLLRNTKSCQPDRHLTQLGVCIDFIVI